MHPASVREGKRHKSEAEKANVTKKDKKTKKGERCRRLSQSWPPSRREKVIGTWRLRGLRMDVKRMCGQRCSHADYLRSEIVLLLLYTLVITGYYKKLVL